MRKLRSTGFKNSPSSAWLRVLMTILYCDFYDFAEFSGCQVNCSSSQRKPRGGTRIERLWICSALKQLDLGLTGEEERLCIRRPGSPFWRCHLVPWPWASLSTSLCLLGKGRLQQIPGEVKIQSSGCPVGSCPRPCIPVRKRRAVWEGQGQPGEPQSLCRSPALHLGTSLLPSCASIPTWVRSGYIVSCGWNQILKGGGTLDGSPDAFLSGCLRVCF